MHTEPTPTPGARGRHREATWLDRALARIGLAR